MKFIPAILLVSLVLLAAAANLCVAQNNAAWGTIGINDTLVYDVHISRRSNLWSTVNEWREYPPQGVTLINPQNITAIRAWDKGDRASASILAGGIFHTYVRMRFTSRRSHGINFQMQIWTRRN